MKQVLIGLCIVAAMIAFWFMAVAIWLAWARRKLAKMNDQDRMDQLRRWFGDY